MQCQIPIYAFTFAVPTIIKGLGKSMAQRSLADSNMLQAILLRMPSF